MKRCWIILAVTALMLTGGPAGGNPKKNPSVLGQESQYSVARQWDEVLLDAIRVDIPKPTVHARNLFHVSVAMWDAWVSWDGRPLR